MPQRNRNTGYKAKKILASTLAVLLLSKQVLPTVFAVDTVLSTNVDNYQTIDENTSLLHTNTEITNKKLIGCNFDVTVILNDGELVSNFDEEILKYIDFTADDNGTLTINTEYSVIISNILEKVNHRIIIENAKDVTFRGVHMERLENTSDTEESKPLLDVLNNTTIILETLIIDNYDDLSNSEISNNSNINEIEKNNILEISDNSLVPAINGVENISLIGNGTLTLSSNEEDITVYEDLQNNFDNFILNHKSSITIDENEWNSDKEQLTEDVILLIDEIMKEEAYWEEVYTNDISYDDIAYENISTEELSENNFLEEASDYLPDCKFYFCIDLGNGDFVDNYDKRILAYVSFDTYIDTGIVTIKTNRPVTISNKYGVVEKVEHKIIVAEGLDDSDDGGAHIIFNGVNIASSTTEKVPVLDLKSDTYITVNNVMFENQSNFNNSLEISENNYHGLTIQGFENIVEVDGNGVLEIYSSVYDSNNYSGLGENVSNIKVTIEQPEEVNPIYSARVEAIISNQSNDKIITFSNIYRNLPVLKENISINLKNPENNIENNIDTYIDSKDEFNIDKFNTNDSTSYIAEEKSLNDKYIVISGASEQVQNAAINLTNIDDDNTNKINEIFTNERDNIKHLGNSINAKSKDKTNSINNLEFVYDLNATTVKAEPVFLNEKNKNISFTNTNSDINVQLSSEVFTDLLFADFNFLLNTDINKSYTDIEQSNELYDYIENVSSYNIELGMTSNIFYADSDISRATIVSAIYAMENSPEVEFSEVFTDIDKDDRSADAIVWAAKNDLIFGIGDDKFAPYNIVTYEEIVAMLHRYAIYKNLDNKIRGDINGFTDFNIASDYAIENLEWAVGNDLIPTKDNYLLPNKKASRGEAAKIISKYIDLCY